MGIYENFFGLDDRSLAEGAVYGRQTPWCNGEGALMCSKMDSESNDSRSGRSGMKTASRMFQQVT